MRSSKFLAAITIGARPSSQITIDSVLNLCSNFVVLDTGQDVFRFAHLSAREYLESKSEYIWQLTNTFAAETFLYTLLTHAQHTQQAQQVGIDLLKGRDTPIGTFLHQKFYFYAADFWTRYVTNAGTARFSHTLQRLLDSFILGDCGVGPTGEFLTWMSYLSSDEKVYLNMKLQSSRCLPATPLFVCCIYNFQEFIPPIINLSTEPLKNSRNIDGRTMLEVALFKPDAQVMTSLIEGGVNITEDALEVAAALGTDTTAHLELLLKGYPEPYVSSEVITAAVSNGSIGNEMLLLLMPLIGK